MATSKSSMVDSTIADHRRVETRIGLGTRCSLHADVDYSGDLEMQGSLLGRYRIESKLGEGGMGVVWRAHDPRLGRDVALKVLPDALVADVTARARLLREARAAAALNHPHILTVYDVGEAGGHVYLALEFVAGESLAARIERGPLPVETAVQLGLQVAAALAHAHERGIVHRDVKASNVLVTPSGDAKVLDFGIATRLVAEGDPTRSMGLTATGALVGTPSAIAPELWRGAAADARSDQWSFGVLLHSMLSGRTPYSGATPYELSAAILTLEPAALPETVPEPVRVIVRRCLARAPEERYPSMAGVQAALAAVAGTRGVSEGAAPAPRRRTWGPALAAGTAIALAMLALLAGPALRARFGSPAGRRIASLAVLPLDNLSRDAEQQYFADGMTQELITQLAQLGIVRVISRTSVMRFRNATLPLPEIARQLGVDAVVEGSVEQVGARVRISAELVRAATDEHVWAHSYEREVGDALALQDEIAGAIANEVRGALAPPRLATHRPRAASPAVVQAYLRGRDRYQRWTTADERKALEYYDQALALDSTFAPAVAARAIALQMVTTTADTMALVRAGIERALSLDPDLGEAHAARAKVLFEVDWDWAGAEREFRRAIALNPNDADAHHHYSHLLAALGRLPEAREQARMMLALDPLAPASHNHLAWLEYEEGHSEASLAAERKALELDPGYIAAYEQTADVQLFQRLWPELRQSAAAATRAGDDIGPTLPALARAMERGRRDEALRLLKRLETSSEWFPGGWTAVARWYATLDRREDAFAALDSAYVSHDYFLMYANLDPSLSVLRADARYAALRRRMRLPS